MRIFYEKLRNHLLVVGCLCVRKKQLTYIALEVWFTNFAGQKLTPVFRGHIEGGSGNSDGKFFCTPIYKRLAVLLRILKSMTYC